MSNLKKTHELIRQNEQIVKKSQKHDANLRKNSTLYFQVGLIVCLLAAYGLLEMKFETTIPKIVEVIPPDEPFFIDVPIIKPETPTAVEPIKQKSSKQPNSYVEVPDTTLENLFKDDNPEPKITVTTPIEPGDINPSKRIEDDDDVIFTKIEQVPIYPGCEKKKTNEDKRKCMSEKITELVQKKFNTNLGGELGLSGKQVIQTQFKIDKTGHIKDIQVRGTHPDLEKEAERVINIIPEMTPGKQHDKNVGVIYNLPIVFQVE